MSEPAVLLRRERDIFRLVLNRPASGNALGPEVIGALERALDEARDADVVVIEGAGRHFCTGFDLSLVAQETDDSLLARFVRIELLLQRVARLTCPTLALAQGRVMGAGADLFAACRFRAATGDASFAFPGARGFGLALGSRRLAARVGEARARDWISTARRIDLAEARTAGLVTDAVDDARALPALLADLRKRCEPTVPAEVHGALLGNAHHDDASDLAALVHSAAHAGLRERIQRYIDQQVQARRTAPPSGS